eukprot:TRINITY_DN9826_c0_g1_i2.p1 TRINITY_DN9826_c0_g1~~TRINITY_DN9826_c0_g1_i2.p1  ORF type:complete len:1073 (+),score=241.14 TRINITY_DN9826_c0_g1_i2:860-4078(+)
MGLESLLEDVEIEIVGSDDEDTYETTELVVLNETTFTVPKGIQNAQIERSPGMAPAPSIVTLRSEKERDPDEPEEVGTDPNTGLPLLALKGAFTSLADIIVHFKCPATQITYKGRYLANRVVIITESTFFLCGEDGRIARAVNVRSIAKLVAPTKQADTVYLCVPTEYDIGVQVASQHDVLEIIKTLNAVYREHAHGVCLTVHQPFIAEYTAFSLKRPNNFEVIVPPQRTLRHLRQEAGHGVAEARAVGQLTGKEQAMSAVQLKKDAMEDVESAVEGRVLALQNDLNYQQEVIAGNDEKIVGLRDAIKRIEDRLTSQNGRLYTEEEYKLQKAKKAKIDTLEQQLAVYQKKVFETQQGSVSDLKQRVKMTLYKGMSPSGLILPENVPLGRLVESLEKELVDSEIYMNNMKQEVEEHEELSKSLQEKEKLILWMEKANLEAGLGYLSNIGSFSGIHGPWINEYRKPYQEDEEEEEATEFITVNGMQLPSNGFKNPDDLQVDPRTGLPVVNVIPSLKEEFTDVIGTMIHFFGPVRTKTGMGRKHVHKRILILSDQALYICDLEGSIKRCVDMMDFVDCFLDTGTSIGLRVEKEHDIMLQCLSTTHRDKVLDIIIKIQTYINEGLHKRMVIRQLAFGKKLEERLSLAKPPDWQFKIIPLSTKEAFIKLLNKKLLRGVDPDTELQRKNNMVARIWEPVKEAMENEYQAGLDDERTEIGMLKKKAKDQSAKTNEVALELLDMKRKILEHTCVAGDSDDDDDDDPTTKKAQAKQVEVIPFDGSASRYTWLPVLPVLLDCGSEVSVVRFLNNTIVTGHPNGWVQLWCMETLIKISTLCEHTGHINSIGFLPNKATGEHEKETFSIFTASSDSSVRRWDPETSLCTSVLQTHSSAVRSMSINGTRLASAGDDAIIHIWDISTTGQETPEVRCTGHKNGVIAVHLDGPVVISAEWGWIFIWDSTEGSMTRALRDEYGGIRCIAVTGNLIAAAGNAGDINVWDIATGSSQTIQGSGDDVLHCQAHGGYLVTSSTDCKIRTWDLYNLCVNDVFHNSYPNEMPSFDFNTQRFIGSEDKFLRMWIK